MTDNVIPIGRRQGAAPKAPSPDMEARREAKRREALARATKNLRAQTRQLNRMLREHADGIDLVGVVGLIEVSTLIDAVFEQHAGTCPTCKEAEALSHER